MDSQVFGTLTITIQEARQLKAVDRSLSQFYVQIVIGDITEKTIKKQTASDLEFNEQFVFNDASRDNPITLTVLCKNVHDREMQIGSATLDKASWNGETRWVMLADNKKTFAGQVLMSVEFERNAVSLRPPFNSLARLADHTGNLIAPADPYIDQGMDMVKKGWDSLAASSMVATTKKYACKLERHHILALVAANGSVLLSVAGTIALCVTIPALLFFPITIFVSVSSAMICAMFAMVLVPLSVFIAWLLVCSHPMQRRVIRPTFHKCLENQTVSNALVIKAA